MACFALWCFNYRLRLILDTERQKIENHRIVSELYNENLKSVITLR